jgi:membrane protein required for colicin V production
MGGLPAGLPAIDVIFLILIAIAALRCAVRGFISELLSMAATIFGILSAIFFYRQGAALIRNSIMPDVKAIPEVIAFMVILLIIYILIKIVEATLKSIILGINLGGLDHLLGFLFGLVEGVVIVCLILFLMTIWPFNDLSMIIDDSIFATFLLPVIFSNTVEIAESVVMQTVAGRCAGV